MNHGDLALLCRGDTNSLVDVTYLRHHHELLHDILHVGVVRFVHGGADVIVHKLDLSTTKLLRSVFGVDVVVLKNRHGNRLAHILDLQNFSLLNDLNHGGPATDS